MHDEDEVVDYEDAIKNAKAFLDALTPEVKAELDAACEQRVRQDVWAALLLAEVLRTSNPTSSEDAREKMSALAHSGVRTGLLRPRYLSTPIDLSELESEALCPARVKGGLTHRQSELLDEVFDCCGREADQNLDLAVKMLVSEIGAAANRTHLRVLLQALQAFFMTGDTHKAMHYTTQG